MDNISENLDLYYNPWTDLNFDQNNQQPVPDTLPTEEDLLTEQEALQLTSLQNSNTEDMDSTQDPWEIFEETTIISGQAIGYNCDEESNAELILFTYQMKKLSISLLLKTKDHLSIL